MSLANAVWTEAEPKLVSPCKSCPQRRGDKDLCAADCRARIEYFCRTEGLSPQATAAVLDPQYRSDPEGEKYRPAWVYEYTCRFCGQTFKVHTPFPNRRRTVCGASRCQNAWHKERRAFLPGKKVAL